jgi:uncharacterized protein (DUF2235 family)
MALYAFDGTGNEDREGDERDSNVLNFFSGYDDALKNDDPKKDRGSLYLKGIGKMARTLLGDQLAEAFGIGGHKRVRQALDRLENNYAAGDKLIDVVGFSRGAALAVSFSNEVASKLRLPIRFLGLWDVVGQFGVPGEHVNAGHNLHLPSNVEHCYHAMALDESRLLFPLTRLCRDGVDDSARLQEVWFRGVHSDVGGGNGNCGLNCISLNWMFGNAVRNGLPILATAITANLVHSSLPQQIGDHKADIGPTRAFRSTDYLHSSVRLEPGMAGRPHNNPKIVLKRIGDDGLVTA